MSTVAPVSARPRPSPARPSQRAAAFLLASVLAGAGLIVRLPSLGRPPLRFHPARQYFSAIIARSYFLDNRADVPSWKRAAALAAAEPLIQLEPRIVERLAEGLYRIAGREALWLPRAASVVFWIFGSLCVYALARRLFSRSAAFAALAVCLFAPYGIEASRSVQPDPLMVALTSAAWLTLVRYVERPAPGRFALAALASAAGVFVKPVAVFFILPAGIFLAFGRGGVREVVRARWLRVWVVLTLLPTAGYYLLPFFGASLRQQAGGRTIAGLWLASAYWRGWLRMLSRVLGAGLLGAAVLGLFVCRRRPAAPLLRGLWAGYVVFGLIFNHHIRTHDYYSLPVIPLAALTLAGLVQAIFDRFPRLNSGRWRFAAAGLLLAGAAFGAWRGLPPRSDDVSRNTAAAYERLGVVLNHSLKTIVLDGDYGLPVFYHAETAGSVWPLSIDFAKAELMGRNAAISASSRAARFSGADYFVATNVAELNAQAELAETLKTRYPRVPFEDPPAAGVPTILVYDLRPSRLVPERTELDFGAIADGTLVTSPQTLHLIGDERVAWTAKSSNPSFVVTPESGTGSAPLTVSVRFPAPPGGFGNAAGTVTVARADGVSVTPVRITLTAHKRGASAPPLGCLDSPPQGEGKVSGSVFFSGWAVDDIEVTRVLLLREPVGGEGGGGPVVVAEIPLAGGARPDIEKAYPGIPFSWRAGWGFLLRPESLPRSAGAGPWTFHVDVEDAEGHRVRLGTRTITWVR